MRAALEHISPSDWPSVSGPASYPPPPPEGSGWGYPGMAPADVSTGAEPQRPATVSRAFALMLARAALSVVGLVITVASRDSLRQRIEEQQQKLGNSNVDVAQLTNVAVGVGVVFGAIFLVLYVLLAFQVRKGRQWARVVTWVLAGLGVLGLFSQFAVAASPASRVIGVLTGLIDLAIIILLALRPTSDYVAEVRRRRGR